jgi:hypothetical protein
MRGHRVFYDLSLKCYKHHKKRKKRFFDKFSIFSFFVMLIRLQQKVVENAATPHFVQNFMRFQMVILKIFLAESRGLGAPLERVF